MHGFRGNKGRMSSLSGTDTLEVKMENMAKDGSCNAVPEVDAYEVVPCCLMNQHGCNLVAYQLLMVA
jgi:hypothetical protein